LVELRADQFLVKMSPAMAAGLETRLGDIGDNVNLIEAAELQSEVKL
jgi:hypothetical protein